MALENYDTTATMVRLYLPQLQMAGATVPGTDEIDEDGEYFELGVADVLEAIAVGGFGFAPTLAAGTYPAARKIISSTMAKRIALYWTIAHTGSLGNRDAFTAAWEQSEAKLASFKAGTRIGELEPGSNGPGTIVYSIGDDTTDDLDDQRVSFTEAM